MIPEVLARRAPTRLFAASQGRVGIAQDLFGRRLKRRKRINEHDFSRIVTRADIGTIEVDGEAATGGNLEKFFIGRRIP